MTKNTLVDTIDVVAVLTTLMRHFLILILTLPVLVFFPHLFWFLMKFMVVCYAVLFLLRRGARHLVAIKASNRQVAWDQKLLEKKKI